MSDNYDVNLDQIQSRQKSRNQSPRINKSHIISHALSNMNEQPPTVNSHGRSTSKVSVKSLKNQHDFGSSSKCLSINIKTNNLKQRKRGARPETFSPNSQADRSSSYLNQIQTVSNFFKDPSVISKSSHTNKRSKNSQLKGQRSRSRSV